MYEVQGMALGNSIRNCSYVVSGAHLLMTYKTIPSQAEQKPSFRCCPIAEWCPKSYHRSLSKTRRELIPGYVIYGKPHLGCSVSHCVKMGVKMGKLTQILSVTDCDLRSWESLFLEKQKVLHIFGWQNEG